MTHWLRAQTQARPLGVDREAKAIRGVILAEEGPFRNTDRGSFSKAAIKEVVKLGKASGSLKSHLSHTESGKSEAILFLLGKTRDVREDTVIRNEGGKEVPRLVARGDLHFGSYAFKAPQGDLATHIMNVVDEENDAFGMSLQLDAEISYPTDRRGRRLYGPPEWMPRQLAAVDVVGQGEATRSMLSSSPTPETHFLEMLSQQFDGCEREEVRSHLSDWMQRALDAYWPKDEPKLSTESLRLRMEVQDRI